MQAYSSEWDGQDDYDEEGRLRKGKWTEEETLVLLDLVRASTGQAGGDYPPATSVDWRDVAARFNEAQASSGRRKAPARHAKQCRVGAISESFDMP